ncbi:unnamed protein product [Withania somnifera]
MLTMRREKERGAPRLVINYKPLNKVLKWIRYPIPNKRDLLKRTFKANIYSKFDMKSGFWQIQINEKDKYKTAFNVPFGQYEWNVMPFGLKNAPSEFQNIMNGIFNPFSHMSIVYIDDVLIFYEDIDSHFKHLNTFLNIIKHNGLVVSAKKINLFQTSIRFLGHDLYQGYGGILKQKESLNSNEQLVRYTSGIWNSRQRNYSVVKKEVLSIVICVSKFQDDLINKKFIIRVDCKSTKDILLKDVNNLISKQIFAGWQALLSSLRFYN